MVTPAPRTLAIIGRKWSRPKRAAQSVRGMRDHLRPMIARRGTRVAVRERDHLRPMIAHGLGDGDDSIRPEGVVGLGVVAGQRRSGAAAVAQDLYRADHPQHVLERERPL